jgi:HD-GYP domain-containing protein (c-di-GMP phosphodiesterase class II)
MHLTSTSPTRRSHDTRIVEIAVADLKVGMHVCGLDRPWLETPFILQGFVVGSVEDIDEIAKYCRFVQVQVGVEVHVPVVKRMPVEKSHKKMRRRETYSPSHSVGREIERARGAHADARALTRSFMDDARLGRAIDINQVKNTVSECVNSILRNHDAMMWLSRIRDKDAYTSEHSLNVGLLAITFGRHLGLGGEDLHRLGISGMLHDVGKMRTPLEILNKEGALSEKEFEVIRNHPQHGRDILMQHRNVYLGAVDVAHSHHEALDGSGYPRRLPSSSISELTRIVTLCDVYDAITSDRCYKNGKSSLDALHIIYAQRGVKFDATLAEQFIQCIGLYPTGSIVELRTGEIGIVISRQHYRHLPKVLILRDGDKQPTASRVVDLERVAAAADQGDKEELVKTTLPNGSYGIRIEEFIRQGLTLL